MKSLKITTLALCLSLTAGLTGCKEYLDVNFDPSFPQVGEGFAILPPMISQMARGEFFDGRYAGQYTQYWHSPASGNVWDRMGYAAGSDAGGEMWRSHYYGIGTNVDLVIRSASAKEQWDYVGVAKAIRTWGWQTTTDFNGDMILKQAWEPNRNVFDYDSQADVYAEVVRLGNEAIADLGRDGAGVSTASLNRGDLVYQGDRTKWVKFVNAVLARNLQHQSNKRGTYNPDAVIRLVDQSFASNADNFLIPHAATSSADANFWGPLRNNMNAFRPGVYYVSTLDGTLFPGSRDPRLAATLTASTDGVFRGVVPALGDPNNVANRPNRVANFWGQAQPTAVTPTTGKYIFQDNAPFPLISFWEMQFIKAEAAFIKGDRATAYTAYLRGINAHLDFVAGLLTDAPARTQFTTERTAYLASLAVAQSASALTLSNVMMQKYISMFTHGNLESWVDLRRYNYSQTVYPGFTPPTGLLLFPDNNNKLVYRARPRFNSEYVWNRAALNSVGGLDVDYHTKEMWFQQP